MGSHCHKFVVSRIVVFFLCGEYELESEQKNDNISKDTTTKKIGKISRDSTWETG